VDKGLKMGDCGDWPCAIIHEIQNKNVAKQTSLQNFFYLEKEKQNGNEFGMHCNLTDRTGHFNFSGSSPSQRLGT
jgi:hypothetical protein